MQIKIGFDKFPVPSISTEVPLLDIVTGENLVDQGGVPLVTSANKAVQDVARSEKATSVVFDSETISSVPIADIFRQTSETSTTILGTSRAETQLSLFADVSTMGLNENNWEVYNYTGGPSYAPWDTRGTKSFGNHYEAAMSEETQEQAIRIGCFPVPYSFPFGSRFTDQSLYSSTLFQQFNDFIFLGNTLYTYFAEAGRQLEYGSTFKDKFLDPTKVYVANNDLLYGTGVSDDQGLILIDEWTRTWVDINANSLTDPRDPTLTTLITASTINTITGSNPAIANTRPGYSSSNPRYSYLQSRKAFRYQPGRISGFTFGAKTSTDSGSNANTLEWGIGNPTDQYTFQVKGASFSIVRRSTVALEASVLIRNGLDPATDQTYVPNGDPLDVDPATGEYRKYYTITIPRDYFNGDPVNGNGKSNYLLNPALVTMYKIEFGWYGAIGARFYAYVPINNNEGRWIILHTLVIENSLGQPCLEDPYFKFRYSVAINDTSSLRTPQYIYKYGASMYIDGGDEGTVTQRSYTSPVRSINASVDKSLIGIYAKPTITNQNGYTKANKKAIFPRDLSVSSDVLTKIKILKCKACPGFGHAYNQGLQTGINGRVLSIKFTSAARNRIGTVPANPLAPTSAELFQSTDVGAKLIADGLWSGYIGTLSDPEMQGSTILGYNTASIDRIVTNYSKTANSGYPSQVIQTATGTLLNIPVPTTGGSVQTYPYPVRLSNYDAVVGSSVPLSGSNIQIQFLNPVSIGSLGHFNEFLLGVTDKKPVNAIDVGLKWEYAIGDQRSTLEKTDMLYTEWTQSNTARDRKGYENGETNYPRDLKLQLDYRIPYPPGQNSGLCSAISITVLSKSQLNATLISGDPQTGSADGKWYLKLQSNVQFPSGSLTGGEIGINGAGTGVTFTSEQKSYRDGVDTLYYASISGQLPSISSGTAVVVQLTPVQLTAAHASQTKIFKFNPYPLYLVAMMRDEAKIYSISVAERVGETVVTSSPKWIANSKAVIDNVGGLAVAELPPVNFISSNRLDSAGIDTQLGQTLRPSSTVDTFFIGAGESAKIPLTNTYGSDRESITTDLLNTEGTFFVGSVIPVSGGATTGSVQISLNTAEQ